MLNTYRQTNILSTHFLKLKNSEEVCKQSIITVFFNVVENTNRLLPRGQYIRFKK